MGARVIARAMSRRSASSTSANTGWSAMCSHREIVPGEIPVPRLISRTPSPEAASSRMASTRSLPVRSTRGTFSTRFRKNYLWSST
jgi:hypothetical protein